MTTYSPLTLLFIIIASVFFLMGCSSSGYTYDPHHGMIVIQPASKTPILIKDNKIHTLSPREEVRLGWWINGHQPRGYSYGQRTTWLYQWGGNEHHHMDWHKFWGERRRR